MKQRILVTHWVGEAYNRLSGEEYGASRYRCFEETGCLITADGSDDHKTEPEDLHGYVTIHPLPSTSSQPIDCILPEPAAVPDDVQELENEEEEHVEDQEIERVDEESDRVYADKDPLVERKICAFYDKWHIGNITWFKAKVNQYRVIFEDQREDFINFTEINDMDMKLI